MSQPIKPPTRREFLQRSALTAAAFSASGSLARAAHTGGSETLRIGLVGCGGRGTGAVIDALYADPHTKLVAIGDTFADRCTSALEAMQLDEGVGDRIAVDNDHIFTGFDAYKQVVDSGVEVVILATPPHFRPEHFEYVVSKDKHCFVEKPVATDMPGLRRMAAACKVARKKKLAVVSGLCWRYDPGVKETIDRIHTGAIGDILAIESVYNTNTLWHRGDKPEWSRMEYQIRNWLYYTWLSGDIIAEQAIHSLDKTAWLLQDASPVSCFALGGRQQRTEPKYGHVYDHFTAFYEYPAGQRVTLSCRQQDGCSMRVEEVVLGTKGKAEILANTITGATNWKYEGPKPSMYRVEHEALFRSIRAGDPLDNSAYMLNSTQIALMGRLAAYSGKTLTWDQVTGSTERLGPPDYAWTTAPEPPVAIPGVTQFA